MIRRYRVPEGRLLTLPADLTEGTGNTRVKGPETVDIDSARVGVHARFIANRIRLGDLEQVLRDPNTEPTAGDHAKPATADDASVPVVTSVDELVSRAIEDITKPSSTTETAAPAAPTQKG